MQGVAVISLLLGGTLIQLRDVEAFGCLPYHFKELRVRL